MDLSRIDLNLLLVLDALVEEKNLARAAARLGLPAANMSAQLAKLRKLVGDPVLVRNQGKMVPTARGWELHASVHKVLAQIEDTLAPQARFDPATSRNTFTLGATDYAEFALLPALVTRLGDLAPGVRVAVRSLAGEAPLKDLETGRVDLVVGELSEVPPGLKKLQLFSERPVAVVRKGHPRIANKASALTPQQVESLSFVQVVPRGGVPPPLSDVLRDAGFDHHVALKVPSFLVAPMVVAQTDHAAVLPERVARHFAELLPIKVLELPVRLEGPPLLLVWRAGEEPTSISWLRNVVAQAGKQLAG